MIASSPLTWKIFILFFLFLPFIHYFSRSRFHNLPLFDPLLITKFHPVMYFLILMPFLIGTAFFFMKRWAWILLTEYSVILIGFQIYMAYLYPNTGHIAELLIFSSVFIPILYLNKENIIVAYKHDFMSIPRGWRNARRYKLQIPVEIHSNLYFTEDISKTGLGISHPLEHIPQNSTVELIIHFSGERFQISSKLVRKNPGSTGFSFEISDRVKIKNISRMVRKERVVQYRAHKKKYSS